MCIFCKIINNEIPSKKIYEDDNYIAILDLAQVCKGHTLIIPKKHYSNILEMSDEEVSEMAIISKKVANELKDKLNAEGMNILSNINEVAGQSVMHTHVHLIPRYSSKDAINIKFNESGIDIEEVYKELI